MNEIGFTVKEWKQRERPPRLAMQGRFCRVEPLDCARHGTDLYKAFSDDTQGDLWTYLTCGPYASQQEFHEFMEQHLLGPDPLAHAIVDTKDNRAVGVASYLRIDPANGCIEVGGLAFSPRLKRTRVATEAMYLMMQRVFEELGYRRYEWKCDALNSASRAAAERLGFCYEGLFRQHIVYKGRNRDTAWYSIIDTEWPALKEAITGWLDPSNFDTAGQQIKRLSQFK